MTIVSKSQLKQWIGANQDLTIIDVLPPDSFAKRHIPGAINIPFQGNDRFVQEVAQHVALKDQRIVVYCANRMCDLSKKAAQVLGEAGYNDVLLYEEGVEGWFSKGVSEAA